MYFVLCLCKHLLLVRWRIVGSIYPCARVLSVVCATRFGNTSIESQFFVRNSIHSIQNNLILFMKFVPEIDGFLLGCERWNETVVSNVQKVNIIAVYRMEMLKRIVVVRWRSEWGENRK